MVEVRVNISNELYEKLRERSEKENKSLSEFIRDILQNTVEKPPLDLEDQLKRVKIQFIKVNYPTKCLMCSGVIKDGDRGLWFKGFGVVCVKCLFNNALKRFTDKDYVKMLTKLRIDIEREKAIKTELLKEIRRLVMMYVSLEHVDILKDVHETVKTLRTLILDYDFLDNPEKETLDKILNKLEDISDKLSKREIPKSWVDKIIKEVGIKLEEIEEEIPIVKK